MLPCARYGQIALRHNGGHRMSIERARLTIKPILTPPGAARLAPANPGYGGLKRIEKGRHTLECAHQCGHPTGFIIPSGIHRSPAR